MRAGGAGGRKPRGEPGKGGLRGREAEADAQGPGVEARIAAGVLLNAALERRGGMDEVMGKAEVAALSGPDRAFARAVALAALRRLGEIDAILDRRLAKRPSPAVMTILRLALAQLLVLETPAFAVVSTAVRQAERDGATRQYKGLVNAVLRGIGRDGFGPTDPVANLPDWLAARWRATYGEAALAGLAEATRHEPPTDLTRRDPSGAEALAAAVEGEALPGGSVRTRLKGDVAGWPGFEDGTWWVQDAAAAAPARLLTARPGETVLDLCAAPGGKTLQLAATGAVITALDRSDSRLKRLRANLARTKLEAEVVVAPAEDWEDARQFDAVLLDAPCTATGTYRRNPEALSATRPADVAKLADVQHRLLDVAAAKVKPGGRLVYCVCSLEREEGETQIIAFLRRNPAFRTVAAVPAEVGAPDEALTPEGWLRILPSMWSERGGVDGFFVARLERVG
ncbi:RsmB/NOP family class I SAM-dependent RNA methyltransferase [Brevundimonas lutea]|uniref:RsmB/NOP family class I SAM-dependent RNA methyltransferase n=1 Tax=Brevundimonas lutea TaxID=2293980 RepID=UPI000F03ECE6